MSGAEAIRRAWPIASSWASPTLRRIYKRARSCVTCGGHHCGSVAFARNGLGVSNSALLLILLATGTYLFLIQGYPSSAIHGEPDFSGSSVGLCSPTSVASLAGQSCPLVSVRFHCCLGGFPVQIFLDLLFILSFSAPPKASARQHRLARQPMAARFAQAEPVLCALPGRGDRRWARK